MAWRNRHNDDDGASESLGPIEIFTSGSGMMVEGSPTAVSAFVDQMLEATREAGGRSRHFAVDGLQVAANVAAFHQTHGQYIEFSAGALERLRRYGPIATENGYYRSFVHDGTGVRWQS